MFRNKMIFKMFRNKMNFKFLKLLQFAFFNLQSINLFRLGKKRGGGECSRRFPPHPVEVGSLISI